MGLDDKIIVQAKMKFPFESYAAISFLSFIILIILKQIFFEGKKSLELYELFFLTLAGFIHILLIFLHQYKKLTVYANRLEIKKLFNPFTQTFNFHELTGFELYQTFGRSELQYWIKIIRTKGKKIVFVKDNYTNYEEMIHGLHRTNLPFMGEKEMKWKYRNVYLIILKWSAILFPIIYGAFLLLKICI